MQFNGEINKNRRIFDSEYMSLVRGPCVGFCTTAPCPQKSCSGVRHIRLISEITSLNNLWCSSRANMIITGYIWAAMTAQGLVEIVLADSASVGRSIARGRQIFRMQI